MDQILFMCPHNAAKSVLATAFFRREAARQGLAWSAVSAGTDPSDDVLPAAKALLSAEGLPPAARPRLVTAADVEGAALVVSLGCDLGHLLPDGKELVRWDDVPAVSQNPDGAASMIRAHVERLVAALQARAGEVSR